MGKFNEALELIHSGRFEEAKSVFEEILLEDPKDADVLYNLGMCFTEMGQPDKAIRVLTKSIEYNPEHSNSYVAMGYAYSKTGDIENAEKYFLEALKLDPNNSYAMRNLGGIYGKTGNIEKSILYLEKAYQINPIDPSTVYGLGYSYQQARDYERADQFYQKVLEMNAPSNVKELAKDGRREIAEVNLKSKGLRMDAVMYMLSALQLFAKENESQVRQITFEISLKGRSGFDVNNPDKKYTINSLPGEFTGLKLVSYMYVGFKKIAPDQDIGIDLSQEYAMALQLFKDKEAV